MIIGSLLAAAVIFDLVMLVLVLRSRSSHRATLPFGWYLFSTIFWTICTAILAARPAHVYAVPLMRTAHALAAFGAMMLIWFCAEFPRPANRFRKLAIAFMLAGLPLLVLVWGDRIVADIIYKPWGVNPVTGFYMPYYTTWWVVCTGSALVQLILRMRHSRGLERLQVRYVLLGSIGLVAIGGLLTLILPILTGSFRFAPYSPLATLLFTTSTSYAILRYRLMDIKIVLRAGLVYSVTIGTLSLLFALLVPLLNNALVHFHVPNNTGSIFLAFLIALAFQPLRHYVQHHVDRFFFKSVYDYRVTLREAGNALAAARDQDILVQTLVNALVRTLQPSGVAVFLPGHGSTYVQIIRTGTLDHLPESVSETHPVLDYAMETDDVMLVEELIRQNEPHRALGLRLQQWDIFVLLPLIAGDRLCGIAMLGEKLSGDIYSIDDIGLLRILGKQAAIALDNAQHYHDMVMMNEYHARLLHIMQDGVIALDPDSRIITFNSAAEHITGVSAALALTSRLADIGLSQLPTAVSGEKAREVTITTPDLRTVPLLVTVTPFTRRLDISVSHLIVFRDLSALRALEQEKMQAERFSSMGAMAASLAHEIKNPLVPIQLFAHLLPTKYDDREFREEFSQTVLNEIERINRLVGQMLDLVRKPAEDRERVDLSEILDRLLVLIRHDCARNQIHITRNLTENLPPVLGVEGQLYQSLLNVLMNAIQVMPDGGELTLITGVRDHRIIISITDTGPGVPPEDLQHIFEPLYTTKTGGHGLGLALTYQFVRAHGGDIHAECQPKSGLTVCISLPAMSVAETDLVCS